MVSACVPDGVEEVRVLGGGIHLEHGQHHHLLPFPLRRRRRSLALPHWHGGGEALESSGSRWSADGLWGVRMLRLGNHAFKMARGSGPGWTCP